MNKIRAIPSLYCFNLNESSPPSVESLMIKPLLVFMRIKGFVVEASLISYPSWSNIIEITSSSFPALCHLHQFVEAPFTGSISLREDGYQGFLTAPSLEEEALHHLYILEFQHRSCWYSGNQLKNAS
ncbi:hypothetical protein EUGRSUZ_J01307 [Eucalyptus grandis]|uniref:Uncharacterized protein n=2 Tax=Eucalyptus grandis TaxID=71139 RepID=A0A059ADP0_EUCGR|nr:hypothetical protein EUGRSUZ_J01307 [Eucalyptus grandis]